MKPKVVVVGSSNTDMVVKLPRLPKPGETIIGGTFSMAAGGKGANQAVAAARAGGDVTFISKVGHDLFGRQSIEGFKNDGLDVNFVGIDPTTPSGIALIFVDELGENSIGVASGANSEIRPSDLEQARDTISSADVLLAQLEIPVATVEAAVLMAAQNGVRVILNPAPARKLSAELFEHVSLLTPNETEAEMLTGIRISDDRTIADAAQILLSKGVQAVIITLGSRGAYVAEHGRSEFVASFDVHPVDTTAAGDVFNGALAVSLCERANLRAAVQFANAAAALSVTKIGAQPSAPHRAEIMHLLKRSS